MNVLEFASKENPRILTKISHIFEGTGRRCSKEEFESLNSLDAAPNGSIVLISDDDFPLMLNGMPEVTLAKLFAQSGVVRSIRGQNFILPYRKGWAKNFSPYYPDFILHLKDGRIVFVELKSILGMCQDETICKYIYLKDFCNKHGYLASMIDVEYLTFEEYLWPIPEDEITKTFHKIMNEQGGFNNVQLEALLKAHPKKDAINIRRTVSSLVLQDPTICNRYCHDDPSLINAVKTNEILPYKQWFL